TQRAPRLMGLQAAAELMLGGKPLDARSALTAGLVDDLAQGTNPVAAGLAFAEGLLARQVPLRRTRDLAIADPAAALAWLEGLKAETARKSRGLFSPLRIIECLEAAVPLPFDEGMALERSRFLACVE